MTTSDRTFATTVVSDDTTVVRGGPDSVAKLARHAVRTHRAFQLDGEPVWGVSVFLALDGAGERRWTGSSPVE